ncbi:MAG: hypothetical protein AAGI23_16765 [Bacteroidota bacterium]
MKYLPLFLAIFFLLTQCADSDFQTNQLPIQTFQIDNSKDTTLQAKDGVTIFIPKGAFDDQNIQIEFKAAVKLEDMVLANLYTMSTFNEPLASHGMFYIAATNENGDEVTLKKEIQVTLPNSGQRDDLKIFQGVSRDGSIRWQDVGDLDNQAVMDSLAIGQQLWDMYCATCHASDLRTDATGPALGNVTLFRYREWLYRYTMNSQKMIAEGDSLALCLWYDWKPVVMTSFDGSHGSYFDLDSVFVPNPVLSKHQVNLIYDFIENESLVQNIGKSEIKYKLKCAIQPAISSILYENDVVWNVSFNVDSNYIDTSYAIDLDYVVDIDASGWYNVILLSIDSRIEEMEFSVQVSKPKLNWTSVSLVFPNFKTNVVSTYTKGNSYYFPAYKNSKIARFPIGEPAIIIVTGYDDERLYFAHRKITYGDNEIEELELQEMTSDEVEEMIRALF